MPAALRRQCVRQRKREQALGRCWCQLAGSLPAPWQTSPKKRPTSGTLAPRPPPSEHSRRAHSGRRHANLPGLRLGGPQNSTIYRRRVSTRHGALRASLRRPAPEPTGPQSRARGAGVTPGPLDPGPVRTFPPSPHTRWNSLLYLDLKTERLQCFNSNPV